MKLRRLLGDGAGAKSYFFGFWTLGSPIVGRERHAPEAKGWQVKLQADGGFVISPLTNIYDGTSYFLAGSDIFDMQVITSRNNVLH
jgi:hypothetical protein